MTDAEFDAALHRKFPNARDEHRRCMLRAIRAKQEGARLTYGRGEPMSDEQILEMAGRPRS